MERDEVVTFRGKRLEDMSREELVTAVKTLGKMIEASHAAARELASMNSRLLQAHRAA